VIELHLLDVVRELPASVDARRFVGLAGTVSAFASVELGLERYDRAAIHHHRLTKRAAEQVFRDLATATRSERPDEPGLEAGRVDVIVGGACILVAVFRHFGFDECLVSEADILDGLAMSLLG
jgi:exopolyphosphatase/guanosine-5'-triphosphate,3'-diphosphate pyrophosphatase